MEDRSGQCFRIEKVRLVLTTVLKTTATLHDHRVRGEIVVWFSHVLKQ